MPQKNEPVGDRGNEPSVERKAIKLGLAMEILEAYGSGGIKAVQEYLSDEPWLGLTGPPQVCSREEALSAIETSRAIVEGMGFG